jgi:hypothetical protein
MQVKSTVAQQLQQPQIPSTNIVETAPQYRPTPIAELERRRRIQEEQTVKPNNKTSNIL